MRGLSKFADVNNNKGGHVGKVTGIVTGTVTVIWN